MRHLIRQLIYLGQLGRMGMSPLTVSVPILGAFTSGETLHTGELLGLGTVGLCAHLFGFALNDLIDQPVDSTLPLRQQHPLITGRLTRRKAWLFTLIQVPIALGIYHLLLNGTLTGLVMLCLSVAASVVYNLWSKKGTAHRLLPELGLAASIGLLCLAGAGFRGDQIAFRSVVFALTLTLILLLVNSVPSGLKDIQTDSAFGAHTFVLATGSRMLDADALHLSKQLWAYSMGLQAVILIGLLGLVVLFGVTWLSGVLIAALGLYGGLHLRLILSLRSFQALRRAMPLLNGYYNYFALALCVTPLMPVGLQLCYGMGILTLLTVPLRLGLRAWRNRYHY